MARRSSMPQVQFYFPFPRVSCPRVAGDSGEDNLSKVSLFAGQKRERTTAAWDRYPIARNNAPHRVNSWTLGSLNANPNAGIPFPFRGGHLSTLSSLRRRSRSRSRVLRSVIHGMQAADFKPRHGAITEQLKSPRHARISAARTRDWYKRRSCRSGKKADFPRAPRHLPLRFPAAAISRLKLGNVPGNRHSAVSCHFLVSLPFLLPILNINYYRIIINIIRLIEGKAIFSNLIFKYKLERGKPEVVGVTHFFSMVPFIDPFISCVWRFHKCIDDFEMNDNDEHCSDE